MLYDYISTTKHLEKRSKKYISRNTCTWEKSITKLWVDLFVNWYTSNFVQNQSEIDTPA